MPTPPSNLLLKLSRRLFEDSADQDAFVQALSEPQPFHPCILWGRDRPDPAPFEPVAPLPWQPDWIDRLPHGSQPGRHPLHQAGYFYCLDFSSVFEASVLLGIPGPVERVLDLCAAPGGKSLFAARALDPQLLLSNEVIGKRTGMLVSNLKRCWVSDPGDRRRVVLSLDTQVLAARLPQTMDVAIVDAPCSGQSLLAKGETAPGCFHPVNINKNANRQKRILANAAQTVAPGGYLAYMTCAFSPEENERVAEWLRDRFPQFQAQSVDHLAAYQSRLSDLPCYRMFPQGGLGAGGFAVLFRNTENGDRAAIPAEFLAHPALKWIHAAQSPAPGSPSADPSLA